MSDLDNLVDDVIDDVKNENGKIPQMINVLSILTFIGAGLGLLAGILLLVGGGTLLANVPGFNAAGGGNIIIYAIATVIGNAACIFGAVKMRKLDKNGFYIYVVGHVIAIVGASIFAGFSVMSLLFPVLFIVLYGTQMKNLK